MKLIKGNGREGRNEWHKPLLTGYVEQKSYGVKVGHVVARRDPWFRPARYVALFDGRLIGVFDAQQKAKDAVDRIGNEWLNK